MRNMSGKQNYLMTLEYYFNWQLPGFILSLVVLQINVTPLQPLDQRNEIFREK